MNLLTKLENDELTLYAQRDGVMTLASDRRGLRPLLEAATKTPEALEGAEVADRVVGLAAAYLLVFAKVASVKTKIITAEARAVLEEAEIEAKAVEETDNLIEAGRKTPCPMEVLARESGGVFLFIDELQRQLVG